MKIKGTCRRCGREFMVEQTVESGGRCPWDGEPFQPDYAAVLVDALRDAEAAGNTLENALEKVADMRPAFDLDAESVLSALMERVARLSQESG